MADVKSSYSTVEKALKKTFETFTDTTSASELQDFLSECDRAISIMRLQLKTRTQIGIKVSIASIINRIKGLKIVVKKSYILRRVIVMTSYLKK